MVYFRILSCNEKKFHMALTTQRTGWTRLRHLLQVTLPFLFQGEGEGKRVQTLVHCLHAAIIKEMEGKYSVVNGDTSQSIYSVYKVYIFACLSLVKYANYSSPIYSSSSSPRRLWACSAWWACPATAKTRCSTTFRRTMDPNDTSGKTKRDLETSNLHFEPQRQRSCFVTRI